MNLSYNNNGQITGVSTYADLAGANNVYTSNYGYDGAGDLTGLTYTAQGNTLAGYTWTFNSLGEITSFSNTEHSNENLTYSYDPAGQLTGATGVNDSSLDEGYVYDATGNRQSTTTGSATTSSSTGANNTLITDGTYDYQYDADGNRIEQTNIATGAYTTYAYDYRNELTSVTSYTSAGVVTQTVTYAYDAVGRQVSETVAVAGGATTETKFVYDGQAIVATLDGTNALTNRYLDGPMVDQVFADEQFDPTDAGELPTAAGIVLYPLVDNQGTARDLVEYDATTATTTIVNQITYTAFGAMTSQSDTTISYLFGYTGFVHDTATGLDKSMTRYYDAVDGLWTQNDPIGFAGRQASLFAFVQNNSTNATDPSGLEERFVFPLAKSKDYKIAIGTVSLKIAAAVGNYQNTVGSKPGVFLQFIPKEGDSHEYGWIQHVIANNERKSETGKAWMATKFVPHYDNGAANGTIGFPSNPTLNPQPINSGQPPWYGGPGNPNGTSTDGHSPKNPKPQKSIFDRPANYNDTADIYLSQLVCANDNAKVYFNYFYYVGNVSKQSPGKEWVEANGEDDKGDEALFGIMATQAFVSAIELP